MSYLGSWKIDDLLTFPAITHAASTGALTDADSVPSYRVYEDENGTAILTGTMSKLDDTNTTGFYSRQLTLSAANGFEKGKCYTIYVTAAVSSVTGGMHHTFQIEAEVDSNTLSAAVTSIGAGAITAAAIADGAIDAGAIADGAIDAATFNTGAIDANALATSAADEIAAAVAASGGDPWLTPVPGAYASGTAGYVLGTRLDVAVSTRASAASVAAVQAKTDNLTFTSGTNVDANVQAVNDTQVQGTGAVGNEWRPV